MSQGACECNLPESNFLIALPNRNSAAVRRQRANWHLAAMRGKGVTTVIFDIGGVIIPTLFETVKHSAFPMGPLNKELDVYLKVEDGSLSEKKYWQDIQSERGFDIRSLWGQCSHTRPRLMTAIAEILKRMPVVALTNDMSFWFGSDWLNKFKELQKIDLVFEASRLGIAKPDPEVYLRVAKELGVNTQRCLFVDDLPVNLEGAASVGMRTLLFDVRDPEGSIALLMKLLALPWD